MISSTSAAASRHAARSKIFQPGEMHGITGTHRVHLLDLSTTGALVYGKQTPQVGDVVRLVAVIPLGPARVMWVSGKRFGVAFATSLSSATVEQILAEQASLVRRMEAQPVITAAPVVSA